MMNLPRNLIKTIRHIKNNNIRYLIEKTRNLSTLNNQNNDFLAYQENVSVCSIQGRRPHMEDEFVVSGEGAFLAVFDGHCGERVSKYLKNNLYNYFVKEINNLDENEKLTEQLVSNIFVKILNKIDNEVDKSKILRQQGSTVSVVYIFNENDKTKYITSNIGDSRIVLCRNGKAYNLTRDHKPDDPIEKERIEKVGGYIEWDGEVLNGKPVKSRGCYRTNGFLAMSRAIGDFEYKPYVSGEPEILVTESSDYDEYLIIATDGFWDILSTSQQAIEVIKMLTEKVIEINKERLSTGVDIIDLKKEISRLLAECAFHNGSYDNITVIVKWLK